MPTAALVPPNPDFESVVRESFGRQTYMATLSATIMRVAPGEVDLSLPAVEFKINLMAPAKGPRFIACGRVLRRGRTLTVCLAEVFTADGDERTPIATMLSTIIVRPRRDDK